MCIYLTTEEKKTKRKLLANRSKRCDRRSECGMPQGREGVKRIATHNRLVNTAQEVDFHLRQLSIITAQWAIKPNPTRVFQNVQGDFARIGIRT